MENGKGKITIGRVCCSDRDDYISLHVEDLTNRRLVDIQVSLAGFTQAITGLGYVHCDFVTRAVYPEKPVWQKTKDVPPPKDKPVLFKSETGTVNLASWYETEDVFATRGGNFLISKEMVSWTHLPTG